MKPTVWYTCPFVPPEWISAHGLPARRRRLHRAGLRRDSPAQGRCPYACAMVAAAADAGADDAFVVTTLCDQMRRAAELAESGGRLFLMHVPVAWQSPSARGLYVEELRRLGRFLESQGGTAPSARRLAGTVRIYDTARRRLAADRTRLRGTAFARALAALHEDGPGALDAATPPSAPSTHKAPTKASPAVALIGGPLTHEDSWILDRIDALGGRIVLNATVGAELTLPRPINPRRLAQEPMAELVDAYYPSIAHPALRPNSRLFRFLRRELASRAAEGILFVRRLWCDTWEAELYRMRQCFGLPTADLDLADGGGTRVRAAGRIQSLLEALT